MDSRIKTVADALHELQAKGKYTEFYNYSGHINAMEVRIFTGEWRRDKEPVLQRLFNLDRPDLHDILFIDGTTVEEFLTLLKSLKDNV
jgi:hypothetical protein